MFYLQLKNAGKSSGPNRDELGCPERVNCNELLPGHVGRSAPDRQTRQPAPITAVDAAQVRIRIAMDAWANFACGVKRVARFPGLVALFKRWCSQQQWLDGPAYDAGRLLPVRAGRRWFLCTMHIEVTLLQGLAAGASGYFALLCGWA